MREREIVFMLKKQDLVNIIANQTKPEQSTLPFLSTSAHDLIESSFPFRAVLIGGT